MKHFILPLLLIWFGTGMTTLHAQETKIFYEDGAAVQSTMANNIAVAVSHEVLRDFGKWHRFNLSITNLSDQVIEFIPEGCFYAQGTRGNEVQQLEVWDYDRFVKKMRRSQGWEGALAVLGSSGSSFHTFHGSHHSSGFTYNPGAAIVAGEMVGSRQKQERKEHKMGYLKRNSIAPGTTVSGFLLVKYENAEQIETRMVLNDNTFTHRWKMIDKKASEPIIE